MLYLHDVNVLWQKYTIIESVGTISIITEEEDLISEE